MLKKLLRAVERLYPPSDCVVDRDARNPLWMHGKKREALLYALLYLPAFAEIDGSILQTSFVMNTDVFPQSFIDAKTEGAIPLHGLEDNFNYVETSHIFSAGYTENVTDEDEELFAECVAEAWRGRLALLYPRRCFNVSVIGPPESGDAFGVSFHEIRS